MRNITIISNNAKLSMYIPRLPADKLTSFLLFSTDITLMSTLIQYNHCLWKRVDIFLQSTHEIDSGVTVAEVSRLGSPLNTI